MCKEEEGDEMKGKEEEQGKEEGMPLCCFDPRPGRPSHKDGARTYTPTLLLYFGLCVCVFFVRSVCSVVVWSGMHAGV